MIEVELPDGRIVGFPDGTSREIMREALQKFTANGPQGMPSRPPAQGDGRLVDNFTEEQLKEAARKAHAAGDLRSARRLIQFAREAGEATKAKRPLREALLDNLVGRDDGVMSFGEKLGTALNMGGEGLTLGLVGDEAAAAADSFIGRGSYEDRLEKHRAAERQFSDENPLMAIGSQVLPSLAIPGGAAVKGGGLLAKSALGAAAGGVGSGLFGFMEGEGGAEQRVDNAKAPLVTGGLLGAAAPVVGGAISQGVNRYRGNSAIKRAAKAAPSRAQLEQQAGALFDQASGASVPRAPFRAAADRALAKAADSGMDDMLTPGAARVASKIDDAASRNTPDMSMKELNVLRRQAQVPAGNLANRTEKAIGTQFIGAVDEYVDSVAPRLGEKGKEARAMWAKLRKMDQMDEIFERAEQYASGFQNGLMLEFRKILKNKKLQRGFTDAELQAMKGVTNPGVLQGLIRQVGRMGFSLDNGSNALGGALSAGGGAAVGGPLGAIAMPLIGTAARKGSETMTRRAAERVGDVVRAPNVDLPVLSNQARGLLEDGLLRAGRAVGSQQ